MSRMTTSLLRMNTPKATSDRLTVVIGDAMKAAKVSQRAMAEATGIPLVTLNRRLTGHAAFTVVEMAAIAEVLNLSIVELAIRAERLASAAA